MHASDDTRGLKIALGAYVLVLALKLAAYFVTGVMALMAEALHTLSDIFVSVFCCWQPTTPARPPTGCTCSVTAARRTWPR